MCYTAFLVTISITHDKMQDKPPLITGFDPSLFRQETSLLLFFTTGITLHIILMPKAALKLTKALTKGLVPASVQLSALVGLAAGKLQMPNCQAVSVNMHRHTSPTPFFRGWEVRK